jgi:F-type H+-transporting ATPase subunit b
MNATDWATLWAFVSLLLFLGLVIYLKVPGTIGKALDKRADEIKSQLAEAARLREEAQALLAEYQRKRKEAEAEAEHILASAKREAAMLADEAKRKTEEYVARRNQISEQKIKQAETDAITAVRSAAVDIAIAAAQQVAAEKATGTTGDALFQNAIEQVRTRLN